MNKTLIIFTIATAGLPGACNKDFVCTCRVQSPTDTTNKLAALDSSTIVDIRQVKSDEADRQCDATREYMGREFAQYKKRTIDCKVDN